MTLEIVPFKSDHIQEAASLVARRYRGLRSRSPSLPVQYEYAPIIAEWLAEMPEECTGVAALENKRLVGFLRGYILPSFLGQQAIYCPDWANGSRRENGRRIIEEMYAIASQHWIEAGCRTHVISVFANDRPALQGWNWMGFGMIAVDSLRTIELIPSKMEHVEIVRAGSSDAPVVSRFTQALDLHLSSAPIYTQHTTDHDETWLSRPHNAGWIAFDQGNPVAYLGMQPGDNCDCRFLRDSGTCHICSAFTFAEARGSGIATALVNHAITWATEQGYVRVAVDFESANSLATRFWTRWFDSISFSLLRVITA